LVAKVTLDKGAKVLIVDQNWVLAYPCDPPLEHNSDEAIIFLVCWCRGLDQRQGGYDSLGVAVNSRLAELLKLEVRP
jgi:hypothetical protein